MRIIALSCVALALALAGCAEESRSVAVSKDAWQGEADAGPWPFTVNDGALTCHAPDHVTFTADGTEYALNDAARWIGGFDDVSAILRQGYVEIADVRHPVPPDYRAVTERGLELCHRD